MGVRAPVAEGRQAKAKRSREAEFLRILAKIRENVPPDMTDEEIDAEIAAARSEVRRGERARGR